MWKHNTRSKERRNQEPFFKTVEAMDDGPPRKSELNKSHWHSSDSSTSTTSTPPNRNDIYDYRFDGYWRIGQVFHHRNANDLDVKNYADDTCFLRGQLMKLTFAPVWVQMEARKGVNATEHIAAEMQERQDYWAAKNTKPTSTSRFMEQTRQSFKRKPRSPLRTKDKKSKEQADSDSLQAAENEFARLLREQAKAKKKAEEQEAELKKAQEAVEKEREAHKAQVEKEREAHKAQVEKEQEAHKAQVEKEREAHQAQLEDAKKKHHEAQAKLTQEEQKKLEDLKKTVQEYKLHTKKV